MTTATAKTMTARFEATCPACHKSISVGDEIGQWQHDYRRKARFVHLACSGIKGELGPCKYTKAEPAKNETVAQPAKSEPVVETPQIANLQEALAGAIREAVRNIDTTQMDADLRGELDGMFADHRKQIDERVVTTLANVGGNILDLMNERIEQEIAAAKLPRDLVVTRPDKSKHTIKSGQAHPAFEDVYTLATARKPVLLIGPAGSGKTFLAKQVADALGLKFGFVSCSVGMSEGQITGKFLPVGKGGSFEYVMSKFIECYETGGVFLLDEVDAADPNVLVSINAALSNGVCSVPNRPENPEAVQHPDFVCIAAANTFGRGADRLYVGRNQLDEATLDRFRMGTIEMDYAAEVDEIRCPDKDLRDRLLTYRRKAADARLMRIVSSRFLGDAYDMKQMGWDDEKIDRQLFSGWSADEIRKVK